jgi:hypothetical protein
MRHETKHCKTTDESSFDIAVTDGLSNDPLQSGNQEGIAAPTVTEQLYPGDTDSLPAADGVLNQCARPLVDSTSDHAVQFEKDKERHEEKVSQSTGTSARNSLLSFAQAYVLRLSLESSQVVCASVYYLDVLTTVCLSLGGCIIPFGS